MSDVEDTAWADGEVEEAPAAEAPESTSMELVDFRKVREHVAEFRAAGETEMVAQLLGQIARWPDSTRYLEDNVWMHHNLGSARRAQGDLEGAREHFARGFELEPRDLDLLRDYSELLFDTQEFEEGLRVMQSLLLHHKRSMKSKELAGIYRGLGATYEALEKYDRSRTAFEKALEHDGSDQIALTGLLRVVAETAEPMEVIRVRQKLIRSLGAPEARSMALLALGDDWLNEFNDSGRALDVYEQARYEHPQNKHALQRIARVGSEVGDWRRVARAYYDLADIADDSKERAEWIVRASLVARDELWESDKALEGFTTALQLDPTRLDAFKAITSILVDSQKWDKLEEAYVKVITANVEAGTAEPKLLAVLWQKLGDLYKTHLDREGDAIFAYDQAAARLPDNIHLHAATADLAESNADHYDKAVEHLREMIRLSPDDAAILERLGKVYLRMKKVDRALCMFRVLSHVGYRIDEKAQGFVDRLDTAMFRPIDAALTPLVLRRGVYHESLDDNVNHVFSALKVGLEEWTGEAHSKYGLKRRDRVKIEEQLAFNNIYRSIGKSLGYENLPELWHKPEQKGLVNGALVPEGLIAGDELLGSGREEFMAFIIAKQLFLFMRPFYLPAIRPATDLQVFFVLGAAHVRPNIPVDLSSKELESAMKAIKKRVKGKDAEMLKNALDRLPAQVDVPRWVEAVEDTANRIGLLFSDDLNACREYLQVEPRSIGQRSVDERMSALLTYAVSEKYLNLREELGIAVET